MVKRSRNNKKKNIIKGYKYNIITFLFSFIMIAGGVFYLSLNYVPKKLYDVQLMRPNMKEAYYVSQWCSDDFGKREFVLWDNTRVDCLAKDYAIEFDFAKKWAESIGQALYYAKMTGKKPAVAIIMTELSDYKYVKRIERLDNGIKIFLIKAF